MKKLKFALPFIALGMLCAVPTANSIPVYAEESAEAEVSEVVSEEEAVSSEEQEVASTEEFNVDEIVIDGKTIAEWKQALKDENTRNSTIIAIIFSAGIALISVLKWLSERGIIKKNGLIAQATETNLEEVKAKYEQYKVDIDNQTERLKALSDEFAKVLLECQDLLADDVEGRKKLAEILLLMVKADPEQIKAGTYKKAREILKGEPNGDEDKAN